MNFLVTGGAGFIGTNLIKRLLNDGHNVVSIDNYSTGKQENHQDGCLYYDYDLSYNYVRDDGDKYDVIFHLAALPRIQPSFDNPSKTFDINVTGTRNILEYARLNNVPVVYAGSSSKHGDSYANPYTFTKWQGEELCKLYSFIYEVPTAICRFYNVYGPHQLTVGEYCTVIGIFKKQYSKSLPFSITGDGQQRRDFTHVDDIVDGLMRVSEHTTFMGEEFEFGSGVNYSINKIAKTFGEDYPVVYVEKKLGEMRETLCTDKKANKLLDWIPTRDVVEYIQQGLI